jgi:hypothetical protein
MAVKPNNDAAAIRCTGTAVRRGVSGAYALTSVPDGRYREEIGGDLRQTVSFNGRFTWATDWSGMPRRLTLGDDETAAFPAWVVSGAWLAPGSRLRLGQDSVPPQDDVVVLTLGRPESKQEARVGLSTKSWLPSWLEFRTEAGAERWEFSDYRVTGGLTVPMRFTNRRGGSENVYAIDAVSNLAAVPEDALTEPIWKGEDTRFDGNAPAVVESRRTPSGHVFVRPRLNGKDVGWFFLDSGAGSMCISPEAADATGMKTVGEILAIGVGGPVKSKLRRGGEIEIGPIAIRDLTFVEIDFRPFERTMGFKVGGICGYDLFARAVVEFEAKTGRVGIFDQGRYQLTGGNWQELLLSGKSAAVWCGFPGAPKEAFRLDTGAGGTLSFHSPAVKQWKLLEGRETQAARSGGVGGSNEERRGTIDWFELAGHRFEKPTVGFSLADKGAFTSVHTAGNIGQQFMAPFTIVFDYAHRRIAFKPLAGQ